MHHALIFNVHNGIGTKRSVGAHRIASYLREQGWDVEVIDWVFWWSQEELQELCRSRITNKTIFCGFSCFFTYWDEKNETFAQWLNDTYPDVNLVIGSQSPPVGIKSKVVKYYIQGYGEKAIIELCKYFIGNITLEEIKFDSAFEPKKVIRAIHNYPAYPLKSLLVRYEDRDYIDPCEWLTMEFSRGCIFKCLFCNFPILGVKEDHSRDAEDFYVHMMDAYDRFGVKFYDVADETFNDYSEKIIKYADVVERLPFDPWFSGFIRADLLVSRPQDWEHLARLGFLGQYCGIDTMNPETAKVIRKGMNPIKLREGLLEAKKYFKTTGRKLYRGTISLIAGLPYETMDSLEETKKWMFKNWNDEHSYMAPLQILVDKNETHSDISLDYTKYGYEPATENGTFDFLGQETLNWINPKLTYQQCQEFSSNYSTELSKQYGGRPIVNCMNEYMQNGETIEEVLAYKEHDFPFLFKTMVNPTEGFWKRFNNYKNKKLSN